MLVDVDPQANATSGIGLDPRKLSKSLYHCLIEHYSPIETIEATAIKGLSILPAQADLAGAEVELVSRENREQVLKNVLLGIHSLYELVFLDCPPALGLLTINALVAASSLLVPVQCEYYAMEGLGRLMVNVERVRQALNPGLEIEGILLTMYDSRNTLSRQVAEEVRGHFKEKVYQTIIPRNVTLAEAPSYGRPVLLYNVASAGAQAYVSLAKEFLGHGEKSLG